MEEQILIFRTSVRNARDIKHIAALFTLCPQIYKWNVDICIRLLMATNLLYNYFLL